LLSELGHEVIVANARKVRLIGESRKKDDRSDARTLARLARIGDPQLQCPYPKEWLRPQRELSPRMALAPLPPHNQNSVTSRLEGQTLRAEDDRWDRRDGLATWVRWEVRPWKTPSGL